MEPRRPIRILCFGDSNTWGCDPRDGRRYAESVRWTGRVARQLGPGHQIVEEGLNGRTTIFDYASRFGKNGREYLRPALDSHFPLDVIVLYLGTNDAKVEFGRTAEEIAAGLEVLVEIALGKELERPSPGVKVVVVAPTLVHERHLGAYEKLVGAEAKTRALPALYRALAARHGAAFVDLSAVPPSEVDGIHLSPEGHARVAELIGEAIVGAVAGR